MLRQCSRLQLVSAGKPLLGSEHPQFVQPEGTWCYHLTPKKVWERRQQKVDAKKGRFETLQHPALPLGHTSR